MSKEEFEKYFHSFGGGNNMMINQRDARVSYDWSNEIPINEKHAN